MIRIDRLTLGDQHDRGIVIPEIRRRGYLTEPFGQALLSPEVRKRLHTHKLALVRWLPDHSVLWPNNHERLALVDSKTCTKANRDSRRHAFELRSILGAQITRIPTYYICHELWAISATDLYLRLRAEDAWWCCQDCGRIFRNGTNELEIADGLPEKCPEWLELQKTGWARGGSGTPFVRIPTSWCQSLDDIFPPLEQVA